MSGGLSSPVQRYERFLVEYSDGPGIQLVGFLRGVVGDGRELRFDL